MIAKYNWKSKTCYYNKRLRKFILESSFIMYHLGSVLAVLFIVAARATTEWGYDADNGALLWPSINQEWQLCGTGKNQ